MGNSGSGFACSLEAFVRPEPHENPVTAIVHMDYEYFEAADRGFPTPAFVTYNLPMIRHKVWERIAKPETAGYSTPKLEALRNWLKTQVTRGMVVVVGGRVLFEYGDLTYVSKNASERKGVLAMLFGNYVASGKVNLRATVKEMGLDDLQGFLPN
jgi:hypothetical protein